jgi:hypothetical protein
MTEASVFTRQMVRQAGDDEKRLGILIDIDLD